MENKAASKAAQNPGWIRSVSMEHSQQSAKEVTAEYHLPHRQETRGVSPKYASTSPRSHFMLDSRALEGEQSLNAKQANKAEPAKVEDKLQSDTSTQRRHDARMPWKFNKAGCSRLYANTVHLANYHKEDHPSPDLKRPFLCETCASKFVRKEHSSRNV